MSAIATYGLYNMALLIARAQLLCLPCNVTSVWCHWAKGCPRNPLGLCKRQASNKFKPNPHCLHSS